MEGDVHPDVHPNLEIVRAAMMEELGIGRKDTLPLEDRGYRGTGDVSNLRGLRTGGSDNPWNHVRFNDVDEAELGLDNIADGHLYRLRRQMLEAGLISQDEFNRGGHRTSKAGARQGLSRGGYGAVQQPSRGNQGGGRGGHTSSPGRKQNAKKLPPNGNIGGPSIPKEPKAMRNHVPGSFDGRRKLGKSAMANVAIASLRGPPPQYGGASPRKPPKSTYGLNLVSANEFYAHAGINALPATHPRLSSLAIPNANNKSKPDGLDKLVLNVRAADVVSTEPANATKSISTPAATSPGLSLIGSKQPSTTIPIAYGQVGLAGSRWATSPVVRSSVPDTPSSEDNIEVVSMSTNIPSTTNEVTQEKPPQFASIIILRSFDGVKISSDSFLEDVGIVRLVANLGSIFANLEILVNNAIVLKEALYTADTFTEEAGTIKFQPYSQKGESSIWKMTFPLPYQSTVMVGTAKDRQRSEPRPMQEHLLDNPKPASPNKELSNVEAPVMALFIPNSPTSQHANIPNTTAVEAHSEDEQLLIDFGADEAVSNYISPTLQTLMILMTDETSIAGFVDRLNQPTGGAFLHQVFSVAGHPPLEGYSPQMLAAARTLVLELYTQSDIFSQLLPEDVIESLISETSQKVLEKALSVWRTKSKRRSNVYSVDDILNLQSHATTVEGRLIPEYDTSTRLKGKASSKASSLSGDSYSVRSRRSTLSERPLPPFIKRSQLPASPVGINTRQFQKDPVFGIIQSDIEFHRQRSLDSRRGHEKKDSSSSTESYNTKDHRKAATPIKRHTQDDFKSEEPLLPPRDLDQKSDSTDSDLLTKLKGLNLDHSPPRQKAARPPSAAAKEGEGNAPSLPSQSEKSRSSVQEINNCDLKGAPGLAASRWAQDSSQSPTSGLRRALSPRTPHTQKMPPAVPNQPMAFHSQPAETPYTPQPVAHPHPIYQPQYNIPPQAFVPQLATVLVQDPITGGMREVTGVQKPVPTLMPFTGGFPSYQAHPIPPVPTLFPIPSNFVTPHRPGKHLGSSPLQGDAPSFSPKSGVRSPLSPTGRENSQIRGQRNQGSSPHN